MGASERDRLNEPRPRPVWLTFNSRMVAPIPGILTEWRLIEDHRHRDGQRWEGMVVHARGGGELPWRVEMGWVRAECLEPMDPGPPPSPYPERRDDGDLPAGDAPPTPPARGPR